jgi:acetyl/propionyl-CoA carboxylase alpha subunit
MIAKMVVWAKDRESAQLKMKSALENYKILGLPTNILFLRNILLNKEFQSGVYDTSFIQKHESELLK